MSMIQALLLPEREARTLEQKCSSAGCRMLGTRNPARCSLRQSMGTESPEGQPLRCGCSTHSWPKFHSPPANSSSLTAACC